jgi:hypothetical protein
VIRKKEECGNVHADDIASSGFGVASYSARMEVAAVSAIQTTLVCRNVNDTSPA